MNDKLFRSASQMSDAENYNDWTFSLFKKFIKGSVLEVGCGVGNFTKRIIEQGSFEKLLSIDISEDSVDYCRSRFKYGNVSFRCADIASVDGRFDVIICMNVLEHIENDLGALKRMIGLLKPSGTLFLLVPAHQALYCRFDVEAGHYRRYSKAGLRQLIKEAAGPATRFKQFYFNIVGAIGYFVVYKIFKKAPQAEASNEIGFFDNWVVPVMRRLECRHMPFGISLVSYITLE